MKKNIISKLLLVMLAIVLTGCEKLPEYSNWDDVSFYDDTDMVIYTLPTSVKFEGYYYYIQLSENNDFSGATIIDFTEQNGSYSTDRVINNLKPGTIYYYRRVSTDNLGGQIYGTSHSFTTKDEDFKYVESITPTWIFWYSYGNYEVSPSSGRYELEFTINFNKDITRDYGLYYNFYIQTPEGDINIESFPLYES